MKISHVERHGTLMQRLLPLRSHRQFASYLLATLLGVLLIMLCLALGGVPATVGAMPIVLIGALAVSSLALAFAVPAGFGVETRDEAERRRATEILKSAAVAVGYAPAAPAEPGVIELETRRPRWLRWEESRIRVETADSHILVSGPIVVVRVLHAALAHAAVPHEAA
jgi:hypothetical protein